MSRANSDLGFQDIHFVGRGIIISGCTATIRPDDVEIIVNNHIASVSASVSDDNIYLIPDLPTSDELMIHVLYLGQIVESKLIRPGRYLGNIDQIGAGYIRGWFCQNVICSENDKASIFMDGRFLCEVRAQLWRKDLAPVSHHSGYNGFVISLPEEAFDEKLHEFSLVCGGEVVSTRKWAFQYRFNIDGAKATKLYGWCFDPYVPDQKVDLVLVAGGKPTQATATYARQDVFAALGAAAAGFDFDVAKLDRFYVAPKQAPKISLGSIEFQRRPSFAPITDLQLISATIRRTIESGRLPETIWATISQALTVARGSYTPDTGTIIDTIPFLNSADDREVLVIIPVYSGFDYVKSCIESVIQNTDGAYELLIINDSSPDPEITKYLRECHARHTCTLLENDQNLGFPRTVNRGFGLARGRDVVVLNADTEVPRNWLSRLKASARKRPNIASVTPMSNNATILSYPKFNFANPMRAEQASEIDEIFNDMGSKYEEVFELPTAVGFCMYITAQALREVGYFGEEWGRGYAEEVDWCLRANDLGYINIACTNLFVLHEGSVSFGVDVREKLSAKNNKVLSQKFPEFAPRVAQYVRTQPLREICNRVTAELIRRKSANYVIHLTAGYSGGTLEYVQNIADDLRNSGVVSLVLEPYFPKGPFDPATSACALLRDINDEMQCFLTELDIEEFFGAVFSHPNVTLHVHSTLRWNLPFVEKLVAFARSKNVHLVATLHDYAWMCPQVQLLDARSAYCGVPDLAACERCVQVKEPNQGADPQVLKSDGVAGWVARHQHLLSAMDRIIAPSFAALTEAKKRLVLQNTFVFPHAQEAKRFSVRGIASSKVPLNIAAIGAIGEAKGFFALRDFAKEIFDCNLPIRLHLIGFSMNDSELFSVNPNINIYGKYKRADLLKIIKDRSIDLSVFFSNWPETYAYTLSEAWLAGVPAIGFDIGAIAERIRATGAGLVIPADVSWKKLPHWILDTAAAGRFVDVAAEFPEPSGTAIATYPWISPASEMQEVDICGEPGIAKRT